MSKVFTNDKGITSRYGSRMNSAMKKEKVECMSVWVKRECGVESVETVFEKIVPVVKLNEEQSLLCKYF